MKISIIGSGAWGTALANVFANKSKEICIFSRNIEIIDSINMLNVNKYHFPSVALNKHIIATNNFKEIVDSDLLLITTPVSGIEDVVDNLKQINLNKNIPIIVCAKGLIRNHLLISEYLEANLDNEIVILSGPNFAEEIAHNLPASSILASKNIELSKKLVSKLTTPNFHLYSSDDIITIQLIGAFKNVVAIACGIIMGEKLGENAKAILITKALSELQPLCELKGGKINSLFSLAGIGDLVLTCNSLKSRNTSFGVILSQTNDITKTLERLKTVEGYFATKNFYHLSKQHDLVMPICDSMYKILYMNANINLTIMELLHNY